MTYQAALVSDRAGSFATVLARPVTRSIEGGRIMVTTLATFEHGEEARAFLRGLRGVDVQLRERMPGDFRALERHAFPLAPPPATV